MIENGEKHVLKREKWGKSLTPVNILLKLTKNPEMLCMYVYMYARMKRCACYCCIQDFAKKVLIETCMQGSSM